MIKSMWKFIESVPMRGKLMLSYLFLLLFAVAIPSTMTFLTISSIIKEQVEHSVVETLVQTQERITSLMRDAESILFILHADGRIQRILENTEQGEISSLSEIDELENRLFSADRFKRKTSIIKLYAANKNEYSGFLRNRNSALSLAEDFENQPWYRETLKREGSTYWQFGNGDSDTYRPMISASMAVTSFAFSDKKLGVLRADIDLRYFIVDDLEKIKFGETGRVLLICDRQLIKKSSNALTQSLEGDSTFYDAIYSSPDGSTYKKLANGENLIVFNEIENTDWKLVAVVPTKELLKKVDIIGMSILLTCLLCLVIAFIFSFMLSHRISKPIRHLAKTMKSFENDLNIRIETNSSGEIGFLYKSFNNMAGKINLLIKDIEEISQKEKNAELKALQAQINPHFLYNTLDSINWLALTHKAPDISNMITSLAKFLRHSLNKGKEFISIENELEQVQSYVNIQKIRYKGKFDVNIQVDKELYYIKIIKLVIQPLVENAIIHGFKEMEYIGEIRIEGYRDGEYFYLKVIDNGIGADTDKLNQMLLQRAKAEETESRSYGISNVNERLKLYYGEQCGISFDENILGGVTATIKARVNTSSEQ